MDVLKLNFDPCVNYFRNMKVAAEALPKEFARWLESLGRDFLDIVIEEVIDRDVIDSSDLLKSFVKGGNGNYWEFEEGNLRLVVGTEIEYAQYVNDGHWTCAQGEVGRFVPGHWEGSKFIYEPGAKTGMWLKQQWVDGKPYWDDALNAMEKMIPKYAEKMLEGFLQSYFK